MSAVLKQAFALRPMQMEDLDAIMVIEPTIYSHPWTRGNFSDSLKSGYSAWVLLHQNVIIGYALMMMVLDEAHLLNISVAKAHQKKGLGKYLLEHMLEMAKRHHAAHMFLEVRTSNTVAILLYEQLGFCEMAVRKGYYPAHQGREDAILMGLAL
ncbi:MAG: ribosomal-protein-alanine N-acetyltransferase [Methylophilaceae bacterium 17-44-8]|jgi:ribosomal-protein-alanine N-acetyltransferase|nr:MAG: ribosomal-protein-alanine N-acetyltransferase [Methylophilales bacterium 28-44-11]OYZ00015.1 MAG: ribosomal-protein-alanine N-acetyltransferase [Methylophilales bacterium 16-45-7]OZA06531.1 MAG: ribosomal-protein-alanine N-acetyltransferase [Methylophilaceae bacterium 17-44-8]